MLRQEDGGFTLVELLVAAGLTGLLSLAIARTVTTAEVALTQSTQQAVSSTQAVRFSELLKYDVAGTQEAYIFAATMPTDSSKLCSSWSGTRGSWTDTTNPNFVRGLFTLEIPTVGVPSNSTVITQYLIPSIQQVGYEVRREASEYALFRVSCDTTLRAQRLLSLGTTLPTTTSGQTAMQCFTADGTRVVPQAGQPTMASSVPTTSRCRSFGFIPPYSGSASVLQRLITEGSLQRLSPVVITR
jgi:type II secretory pathway pseudopilin PulG